MTRPDPLRRALAFAALAAATVPLAGCVVAPVDYPDDDIYVTQAPPPPRTEMYGMAPGPDYFWIDGYWRWGGQRYGWVPGYWERPRPGYRWVPHAWSRQGRGWRESQGGWRRGDDWSHGRGNNVDGDRPRWIRERDDDDDRRARDRNRDRDNDRWRDAYRDRGRDRDNDRGRNRDRDGDDRRGSDRPRIVVPQGGDGL